MFVNSITAKIIVKVLFPQLSLLACRVKRGNDLPEQNLERTSVGRLQEG